MIDMHAHVLPNVDDGSRTIEETIQMLIEAKAAGFEKILLTPHFKIGDYEVEKQDIELLTYALNEKLGIKKVFEIDLYVGNEIYVDPNMVKNILENKASRINNSRYILFEIPFQQKIVNIEKIIENMQKHGLIPILAHPERYELVQKNPDIIKYFKNMGVVMQCNFTSILGDYGSSARTTFRHLLKNGQVDILR